MFFAGQFSGCCGFRRWVQGSTIWNRRRWDADDVTVTVVFAAFDDGAVSEAALAAMLAMEWSRDHGCSGNQLNFTSGISSSRPAVLEGKTVLAARRRPDRAKACAPLQSL